MGNFNAFKTHLETYALFLCHIPRFAFLFASPDAGTFTKAESVFRDSMKTAPTKLCEQVSRYFKLRTDWEAKRYGLFERL